MSANDDEAQRIANFLNLLTTMFWKKISKRGQGDYNTLRTLIIRRLLCDEISAEQFVQELCQLYVSVTGKNIERSQHVVAAVKRTINAIRLNVLMRRVYIQGICVRPADKINNSTDPEKQLEIDQQTHAKICAKVHLPVEQTTEQGRPQIGVQSSSIQATGTQFQASYNLFQASGTELQASGSHFQASGIQFQASGTQYHASGSQFHASGTQFQTSNTPINNQNLLNHNLSGVPPQPVNKIPRTDFRPISPQPQQPQSQFQAGSWMVNGPSTSQYRQPCYNEFTQQRPVACRPNFVPPQPPLVPVQRFAPPRMSAPGQPVMSTSRPLTQAINAGQPKAPSVNVNMNNVPRLPQSQPSTTSTPAIEEQTPMGPQMFPVPEPPRNVTTVPSACTASTSTGPPLAATMTQTTEFPPVEFLPISNEPTAAETAQKNAFARASLDLQVTRNKARLSDMLDELPIALKLGPKSGFSDMLKRIETLTQAETQLTQVQTITTANENIEKSTQLLLSVQKMHAAAVSTSGAKTEADCPTLVQAQSVATTSACAADPDSQLPGAASIKIEQATAIAGIVKNEDDDEDDDIQILEPKWKRRKKEGMFK